MCRTRHGFNELCFMQPIPRIKNPSKTKTLFIFYDFETRQDTSYMNHPTTMLHIPNLCVAQLTYTDYIDNDDLSEWCGSCGVREHVFKENPVRQLIDLAVREQSIFKNIIVLSHNGRGFDNQFTLCEMAENMPQVVPSVTLNGQNIIVLSYGRTKFIDSLNYFSMKLSQLPRAFNLPKSNKKGYFPHFINTLENQIKNYEGPLPDPVYYGVDQMSESVRSEFFEWYDKNVAENYVFNLKKEIVEYCRMDVDILRRACLAFRKIVMNASDTDPFVSAVTIASTCSYIFRKNYLKPNTIGIIPTNGYRRADKHSQKSIEWLLYCEQEVGREIIHAGRGRERRLREGMLVDGFLEAENGRPPRIWEFSGDIIHGCRLCFKTDRDKRMFHGRTLNEAYESTCAKMDKMRSLGYEVEMIWECEWDAMKANNPEIKKFLDNHPVMNKITLNPRDAFYGGRTENIVTHYEIKNDEKINYTDICSLYPYVCKRGKYPLGHPKIYIGSMCDNLTDGNNNDLSRIEGLVKCKVLPPRNLFLPVLPIKMHGRLLFALCRSCCVEMRQTDCDHEDPSEREFTGVWVSDELKKAVEKGYTITEIYIVWKYKITQFDQSTGDGGIFAGYVNTFLKLKQEASGWPSWCIDDITKQQYVNDYLRDEGIELDSDKIEKNPGLRSVAKLMLNCIWGKFGERSNLKRTEIIKTREELVKLLLDNEKEVFSILAVNDSLLYANWQLRNECVESQPHTNVVIAAYTTAQGRLKLYEHLEKLDRRALYFDTDSCVFLTHDNAVNEYTPKLGSLLGDMTDELKAYGDGTYIDIFLSGGPKFYCYKTYTPSTGVRNECIKVKGITLNFQNSCKINYDSMKEMIFKAFDSVEKDIEEEEEEEEEEGERKENNVKLRFRAIRRMPAHKVVTRTETKTCSVVLMKRRYISHTLSLPFGYKSN